MRWWGLIGGEIRYHDKCGGISVVPLGVNYQESECQTLIYLSYAPENSISISSYFRLALK